MVDIYGMMRDTQQSAQDGYARGQKTRLAGLVQQSMQAPRDQRQGLLAQMAGIDPQAAYNAEGHFKGMDDTARARLGEYASAFDALPDEQKAAAYPQLAKQAQELGIPAPGEWNPAFAPNITKLAQALRTGATGTPTSVQEFQYMTKGFTPEEIAAAQRVHVGIKGRASNAGMSTVEVEQSDGSKARYTFDPRRGTYVPFTEGGPQAPQVPAQQTPAPQGGDMFASLKTSVPGLRVTDQGIRTPEQNAALPNSVPNSFHLKGQAIDIGRPTPEQQQGIRTWAAQNGMEIIDKYGDGHWHLEPRGSQPQPAGPRPGVGMSPAARKAAEVAAQQATELQFLPDRGEIEAQNEGRKVLAKGAAEAQVAQQFGTDESRKQAADASKKLPQLAAVGRGVERIANALKALNMPGVNTGPLDQYITRQLPAGQELETAVGEIQDSMLALVRVPGVGSQSDLEARVSAMKYPSLNRDPAVNARTMKNLLALYQDLRSAYDNVINRPTSNGGGNGDRRRALLDKY